MVVLTEPEVLAISIAEGAPWPSPLTTIPPEEREEAQRALGWGAAVLVERGLAEWNGDSLRVRSELRELLALGHACRTFVMYDGVWARVANIVGPSLTARETGDDTWVAEFCGEFGRRTIDVMTTDELRTAVAETLRAVYEAPGTIDGREDSLIGPFDLAVYVGIDVGPGRPMTVVAPGRLVFGSGPVDGGFMAEPDARDEWSDEWLGDLFTSDEVNRA